MFHFGTLLSPLHPLVHALLSFFAADGQGAEEDEPEGGEGGQKSEKGDTDPEDGDDDPEGEEDENEDDPEEDELEDDLPADDKTRRNAARLDSEKEEQLTASMEALVDLLVENPDIAERKLTELREEQPLLAAKLAKMFKNKANNKLGDLLEGADEAVKKAFGQLAEQVKTLSKKTEVQLAAEEKRVYLAWEKEAHPYLNPKSTEGKTKLGNKLRVEFYKQLDRLTNDEEALDEDTLEDALAVAKRRVGWNDRRVKRAVEKFAVEQAAKGRGTSTPKGGKGAASGGEKPNASPEIASMFNKAGNAEHLKKVAEAKKAGGFKQ